MKKIYLILLAVLAACKGPGSSSGGTTAPPTAPEPFLNAAIAPNGFIISNTNPYNLGATVIVSDTGEDVTSMAALTWQSSDTSVVTVDSSGQLTPVADGDAVISLMADYSGYTSVNQSINVHVIMPNVVDINGSVTVLPSGLNWSDYTGPQGSVDPDNPDSSSDFSYFETELIGGSNYRITGYNAISPSYLFIPPVIPAALSGSGSNENITEIADGAFQSRLVEYVIVSEGITAIRNNAFFNSDIREIYLPDGLTVIESNAFSEVSQLEKVYIGNGASLTIESQAFYQAPVETARLGTGIQSIGARAFYQSGLETLVIGSGLISIGSEAFFQNTALVSVSLPEGLTTISADAFHGNSELRSVTIPSTLSTVGPYAFKGSGLLSLSLPAALTTLDTGVFSDNTDLSSVTFSEGLTAIGDFAFENASSLNNVVLPDSLLTIGQQAFSDSSSLSSLTFGSGLTTIGFGAFFQSDLSGGLNFPVSLQTLDIGAFAATRVNTVQFPAGTMISTIGLSAFLNSTELTDFHFSGPSSLTELGENIFFGASKLANITLPEGLTTIAENAFRDTIALTSITIPSTVYNFGASAFNGSGLQTVIILGDGSANPGGGQFPMDSMGRIDFFWTPDGLASGSRVFGNCDNLTELTFYSTIPPRASDKLFGDPGYLTPGLTIRVPTGSKATYEAATAYGWDNYSTALVEFTP